MQTRKRAKSATFGKKVKEKEEIKKAPEKEVKVGESDKTSEKAEIVERRTIPEKPQSEELSATLPQTETESSISDVATPEKEFVADNPTAPIPTTEKTDETPVVAADEALSTSPNDTNEEVAQPLETPPPTVSSAPPSTSQDLSPTLPQSAFTIQNDEPEVSSKPEEEKKRFGVYFFVVAFLSFILGLGAMAAVSYFGLINLSLPKVSLPTSIHMLGSKPTPTPLPKPTTAPTVATVNLQQYSIDVLNGSGVTGQAAKFQKSLTNDGFKVSSTGNADNSNHAKTEISTKKSVSQAYITKLEDELKKNLDVDSSIATSPDSDTTDVTVTLGSSTAQ